MTLSEDDEVRILVGPLTGKTGLMTSIDDGVDTVIIEVFSRTVRVELPLLELERVPRSDF
jgi:transcription antitermination factor NusG